MTDKDYYKVLQVDPSAEPEVITGAYRRLALKYHPDTNQSLDSTRMLEINEAYEVLSDPAKRQEYDRKRQGSQEDRQTSAGGNEDRKSSTRLIYQSDFYHPPNGIEGSGDYYSAFCNDGYFHLVVERGAYRFQCLGPSASDFDVKVDAQFAADSGKLSSCGIIFWHQWNNSYYLFGIDQHARYGLFAMHNLNWKTMLKPRYCEFLNTRVAVNNLAVKAIGTRIELSANGHFITAVEENTASYGEAGVYVQAQDSVGAARFRDFRLYSVGQGHRDKSGSKNQHSSDWTGKQVFSQCPNCGSPLHTYDTAGIGVVTVQFCPVCGWNG